MGGDLPELDDCEEDDHFDPADEWDDEVWARYTPEQIEEFKKLGVRLEKEEVGNLVACYFVSMHTIASYPNQHPRPFLAGSSLAKILRVVSCAACFSLPLHASVLLASARPADIAPKTP